MLRHALDGFILLDPKLAKTVLERDDEIDELNRVMTRKVVEFIKSDKKSIEGGLQLIPISRNLERVADLATNIAEDVIFTYPSPCRKTSRRNKATRRELAFSAVPRGCNSKLSLTFGHFPLIFFSQI